MLCCKAGCLDMEPADCGACRENMLESLPEGVIAAR